MAPHRIVIADDHPIVRSGIRNSLTSRQYEIIAEARSGEQLLEILDDIECDLVLLDAHMPGMGGLAALTQIKKRQWPIRAVVMSMDCEPAAVSRALDAGADGYYAKTDRIATLKTAITAVMAGKKAFSPSIQSTLAELGGTRELTNELTRREKEVLTLVGDGLKQKEIAQQLGIAVRTVEFHKSNLRDKLQARSLADLIKHAQKLSP